VAVDATRDRVRARPRVARNQSSRLFGTFWAVRPRTYLPIAVWTSHDRAPRSSESVGTWVCYVVGPVARLLLPLSSTAFTSPTGSSRRTQRSPSQDVNRGCSHEVMHS